VRHHCPACYNLYDHPRTIEMLAEQGQCFPLVLKTGSHYATSALNPAVLSQPPSLGLQVRATLSGLQVPQPPSLGLQVRTTLSGLQVPQPPSLDLQVRTTLSGLQVCFTFLLSFHFPCLFVCLFTCY
jgi:hypothetical protein